MKTLSDIKSILEFSLIVGIVICFLVAIGSMSASLVFKKAEKKPSSLYEYWTDERII